MYRTLQLGSWIAIVGALAFVLAACTPVSPGQVRPFSPEATQRVQAPVPEATRSTTHAQSRYFGYTYQQADGNRLAVGTGRLPAAEPIDIPLTGTPLWVVAAPIAGGSIWVAVLDDGQVQAFRMTGRTPTPIPIQPDQMPAGMPPLLIVEDDVPRLLAPPDDASTLTHPVLLPARGRLAYIATNGDVVVWDDGELARFPVAALPDARILVDEQERLLLLTGATNRYDHGILGDALEAASITLIETQPEPRIAVEITIPPPQVIEGLAPLWADLDGDSRREIIVTISDNAVGAREVVFNAQGDQIAAGQAIGRGHRWRHQIAVAPLGLAGEIELAEVLTPHIGGVVQTYRLVSDRLEIVASAPGFTSHSIGSRNLDAAAAGDFDGNGRVELLLPDQAFQTLGALARDADGIRPIWTVPLGGRMTTNLATVRLADGTQAVGAGRDDGVLRVWQ